MFRDTYPVQWTGGQAVVTLPEHINAANVGQIREELLTLINRGAATLIVDMTATASCDYAGAEALVRAYRRAVANGTQLQLVVPAEVVRHVLTGNGLHRLVSVYPSQEAATAAGLPVAQASTAGPSQVSQDLLDGTVRNLFHAGLSLQAALDAAHETGQQYIMEALRYVDEAIRDIRDHVFITAAGRSRPHRDRQTALSDAARDSGMR
ncbi:MAG TPA: STAS domain-containing protein [Streptosporangiaceae bacterium]|nr:STAS domain-containing protein [Streptosporangiaceae bacterium]